MHVNLISKFLIFIRVSLSSSVSFHNPQKVARGISQGLADSVVTARLDGTTLWDLDRPLEASCKLELVKFDSDDGQHVFWHSSAHILGQAMERLYGGHLCAGPPVEGGFYYDMFMEGRYIQRYG